LTVDAVARPCTRLLRFMWPITGLSIHPEIPASTGPSCWPLN